MMSTETPEAEHRKGPLADVVVVHFNAPAALARCIAPLLNSLQEGASCFTLTVIDNDHDQPADAAAQSIAATPRAHYLPQQQNRGFGAASNLGAALGTAPYVLFLNPDCTIDPSSIRQLVQVLEGQPDLVATGPQIQRPDGLPELSWAQHPGFLWEIKRRRLSLALKAKEPWAVEEANRLTAASRPVDWLTGACLLVRRSAFEAVGGFDERFFLYFEDADLCLRLANFGAHWFDPSILVVHQGGASTVDHCGEDEERGKKAALAHYRASQRLYYQLHRPTWERAALWTWRQLKP